MRFVRRLERAVQIAVPTHQVIVLWVSATEIAIEVISGGSDFDRDRTMSRAQAAAEVDDLFFLRVRAIV